MWRIVQMDWTVPITSRLLLEAGGVVSPYLSHSLPYPALTPGMIPVMEQSTDMIYRSGDPYFYRQQNTVNLRGAVSYVTGAHGFKAGFNHTRGYTTRDAFDYQPLSYRFNNGVPNQLTQRAMPWFLRSNVDHNMGVFAQDRWTIQGLTLTYGVRYDYYANSFPEQHVGPALLAPKRDITFPAQKALAYHDVTPKFGASYDPFGTGKTAVKVGLSKYLTQLGGEGFAGLTNPVENLVETTTRAWNDANRNFAPDCDLLNPLANGECGLMANTNFGGVVPAATYDPDLMRGWGRREYNWEFSAGVQQELLPRVAADVTYFRRRHGNFNVVDNLVVDVADFDKFSITAPVDPRLPGGGGYVISGLYDINPAKFGVPAKYFVTRADNYGKQISYWQGVDVTLNARPRPGVLLQGGASTGRGVTDKCEIVANLPEASITTVGTRGLTIGRVPPNSTDCRFVEAFLTQVKFLGSYTIPRVDVQVSGTFQNLPGPQLAANYTAPNAEVAPSLGRNLAGGARNVTVNLINPGTMYGERLTQLDLRVAKVLRFGGVRTKVGVDLYNALNSNAVEAENSAFAVWRQPIRILQARFVKLNVQIDF